MTPKTATVRLYVALVTLVAALFELGAALARLGASLALRATLAVRPHAEPLAAPPRGRPNLRVVPSRDAARERLVFALTELGWPAPAVRQFVGDLGDRVGREPIETLIREGIAKLAA